MILKGDKMAGCENYAKEFIDLLRKNEILKAGMLVMEKWLEQCPTDKNMYYAVAIISALNHGKEEELNQCIAQGNRFQPIDKDAFPILEEIYKSAKEKRTDADPLEQLLAQIARENPELISQMLKDMDSKGGL